MSSISALLQDLALDHANPALSGSAKHDDDSIGNQTKRRKRKTTREKIESMVNESTKNYPAYLKLIYTGESDYSSEDEMGSFDRKYVKTQSNLADAPKYDDNDKMETIAIGDRCEDCPMGTIELANGEPLADTISEKISSNRRQVKKTSNGKMRVIGGYVVGMRKSKSEDSFYDTIETSSPDLVSSGTDLGDTATYDTEEDARHREEWHKELVTLEGEIVTLRTVLGAKVNKVAELKRKLGISPITELKSDVRHSFNNLRQSDAYQKTGNAFKSFTSFASKKFGDIKNSETVKSLGDKMGGAYSNVKTKMSGSKSTNFNGNLNSPTSTENPSDGGAVMTSATPE